MRLRCAPPILGVHNQQRGARHDGRHHAPSTLLELGTADPVAHDIGLGIIEGLEVPVDADRTDDLMRKPTTGTSPSGDPPPATPVCWPQASLRSVPAWHLMQR
jgi:hypothetical protein